MPLVRIAVSQTRTKEEIKAISDGVYNSLVEAINVPQSDNFQIFTKHTDEELIFSKDYLGIDRSSGFISIQIFCSTGRTIEQKKKLYKTIAEHLHEKPGIRKEDIFINLVEVAKENWSFGNGIAQYAE